MSETVSITFRVRKEDLPKLDKLLEYLWRLRHLSAKTRADLVRIA